MNSNDGQCHLRAYKLLSEREKSFLINGANLAKAA